MYDVCGSPGLGSKHYIVIRVIIDQLNFMLIGKNNSCSKWCATCEILVGLWKNFASFKLNLLLIFFANLP